jgi:TRAP-type mannitol/chloroaromatic compound transport system substrate-binding protein
VPTFELLDAVKNNILQAAVVWPGYFTGKEPAFAAISDFIYAYEDPRELEAWFYYRGGKELLEELYGKFGVNTIGFASWGVESMFAKYPIKGPDDFKGHKFRSPQGMTADVWGRLGGSVVVLPGEETYSALDKGVIDGLDWATPYMNHRLGFDRVAKYFIYPENRSCAYSTLIINKKQYEKLPANLIALLESAMREYGAAQLARLLIEDHKAVKEMKASGSTQIVWDKSELKRMRDITHKVWKDWAEKSPITKKVVESQIEWVKFLDRIE